MVKVAKDELAKTAPRLLPEDNKPVLYGAIAVCVSGTLTTDRVPFCIIVEELKSEEVPERFREGIENFTSYNDPNVPASEETDRIFRNLGWDGDGLGYIFDDRRGGPAPYCGLRFLWSDDHAVEYILEQNFTKEELDWLWFVAQRLHTYEGSKPQRRQQREG